MKRAVAFRPSAEGDIERLYSYILERSDLPDIAFGYVQRIRRVCEQLADFPERGTRRSDLGEGVRTIGFERRVTILFQVKGESVEILRILYGGRELRPDLMTG